MLNRVILIGRLTKDPELRYSQSGTAVATFTLAVDRARAKEKETDFIPIVVWQKQAENCANYIGKGSLVAVDGRLQVRTYDAKDGTKRWMTEVIAESVRFLDSRANKDKGADNFNSIGQEVDFTDDDIPF